MIACHLLLWPAYHRLCIQPPLLARIANTAIGKLGQVNRKRRLMIHGSINKPGGAQRIYVNPRFENSFGVSRKCQSHRCTEPRGEENEGEHDARSIRSIGQAGMPEPKITKTDGALWNGRLQERANLRPLV